MLLNVVAFLIGDSFLQFFSFLPNFYLSLSGCLLLLLMIFSIFRSKKIFILFIFLCCGFLWTLFCAQKILYGSIEKSIENKVIEIEGTIFSIPIVENHQTRFLFKTSKINQIDNKKYIQLSLQDENALFHVGDKWLFFVKLKKIHGLQNINSFDYERFALMRGIQATGYILKKYPNQKLKNANHFSINRIRELLKNKIENNLPASPTARWLIALTVGERTNISTDQWDILRKTGTNHLMAIAGLHIGMIACISYFFAIFLWRLRPNLILFLPMQSIGVIFALLAAGLYSLCAGFALPTKRALIMLACYSIAFLFKKASNHWNVFAFAMLIILIVNPLEILAETFWLSFGTIALIIYGAGGRLSKKFDDLHSRLWWKWGRVQWVIGIGLIPLSILFFQEFSILGFIANFIAIPWLSFTILPFCLLAILTSFNAILCGFFLKIADFFLSYLWIILTAIANLPISHLNLVFPHFLYAGVGLIGILILLMPAGIPGKGLSVFWFLSIIFYIPQQPKINEIWFTVLDVGQGLATIIRTKSRILIYDTGGKFGKNDMGKQVVLPYLNYFHIDQIDAVVISHGDNDHVGGLDSILKQKKIKHILTCEKMQYWKWDNIQFTLFQSKKNKNKKKSSRNNASCLLKIDNGYHSLLLPGDIEKSAEKVLVKNHFALLNADILIAPHHGSKTSSHLDFIESVNPSYVIFATGYLNRFHFPSQDVVSRFQSIHSQLLNTADEGMIHFQIDQQIHFFRYRNFYRRYWMY